MQRPKQEFDPKKHDSFQCLTIDDDYCQKLEHGIIRGVSLKYCPKVSSEILLIRRVNRFVGDTFAKVRVKGVFHCSKMSPEDATDFPIMDYDPRADLFCIEFEQLKKVVEIPIIYEDRIWTMYVDKDNVVEYPTPDFYEAYEKYHEEKIEIGLWKHVSYTALGAFIFVVILFLWMYCLDFFLDLFK